ncbi:4Fe-4S dicluster domain-containing protein [Desulfovibrio aminophilus]|uniref:4Fe-4S dicluster domain-containing protein n=1 Tax=Desulfovibrio aminophilus TaxID=81425 RepID=UPI00040C46B6|nr:4Fe-4S dicluster domain-containing protein [Desulfovibrio aminophilus]
MNGKSFFVDLSKCTACRGCQVSCKQWKKLPAEKTVNTGSHQNPADLSFNTLKVVRFSERVDKGKVRWFFLPDQCRHCVEPPCKMASSVEGSILHDQATGAVVFTPLTAQEDFEIIRGACPYDIPRQDPVTKVMSKCDMCTDRVRAGMLPACVKTCPTGAMNFGDRDEMLKLAQKSLAGVKKKWPKAQLVNADDVRVIFLAVEEPEFYAKTLMAQASEQMRFATRRDLLAQLLRPVRSMTSV